MSPQQRGKEGFRGRGGDNDERMELPLPETTRRKIKSSGILSERTANAGLLLDKFVPRSATNYTLEKKQREKELARFCNERVSEAGRQAAERMRETVQVLHPQMARCLRAKVSGRLLIDHGRAHAAEAAVSFHPIWGVPRIPASAIKGALRALCLEESAARFADLFGEPRHRGTLVFYDAVPPDGRFQLALDVVTPHFGDYYRGTAPPAEYLSPVPSTFLTVVDTSFELWLAYEPLSMKVRQSPEEMRRAGSEALDWAVEHLTTVLKLRGLGAKTNLGYGRFSDVRVVG